MALKRRNARDAASEQSVSLEQARQEFASMLSACAAAPEGFRVLRAWLAVRGAEALRIDPAASPGLPELIRRAAAAPASPARRIFAVLVLDAQSVPGLLTAGSPRARLERDICALLETALPHALARAGYPFGGDLDARRRHIAALADSIGDYLQPLEPSIPTWLSGRSQR